MRRARARPFWCPVVSEEVLIRLKRPAGLSAQSGYFVQCNQTECQYVEANEPPCPLSVGMFDDEIRAADAARASRHEEGGP